MRVQNDSRFLFGTRVTSRTGRQLEMVAIVRAAFRLEEGASSAPYVERDAPVPQGMLSGERHLPGDHEGVGELLYPGDFADFKPRADALFLGSAYAPRGEAVPHLGVRFAVGAFSKIVRVVGDRRWEGPERSAAPTAPRPFEAMPITWSRAWGAAADPSNPVGRDLASLEVPNLERPDEPILSRREARHAIGLGPINARWALRQRKLGEGYDAAWRRERAPYLPTGVDWTYFNAAPADQQLEGHLRGDEVVRLQNLHPTVPLFETRLAGVRVRVLARRASGATVEIPMVLDTLLVDGDARKIVLTWRGLTPVERLDLDDVPFVLVHEEPLGAPPAKRDALEARLAAFAADPMGIQRWSSPELEALRATAGGAAPIDTSKGGPEAVSQLLAKRFGPLAEPHRAPIRDFLKRAMSEMGGRGDLGGALTGAAARGAARPGAAPVGGMGGGTPAVRIREQIRQVEEAARKAQRDVAEQGKRPRELSKLANLSKDPRLQAMDPSLAAAGTRKRDPAPRPGGSCAGSDFAGRVFDGQDLRGVDLSHARLSKASFKGAKLDGAKLDGALCDEADFSGASLIGATFAGANLTRATLARATADRIVLSRASAEEADLRGARLSEARLEEVLLRAARLDDASLERATLLRCIAGDATLERADLRAATIEHCLLTGVKATGVKLGEATITTTSLAGAVLDGADLQGASAEACSFLRAHMTGADLRNARLAGAFFVAADLVGARFTGADLKGARFSDAVLRQADLRGTDLLEADLSRSVLEDATLQGANAYGALFFDAKGQRARLDGANLKRSLPEAG